MSKWKAIQALVLTVAIVLSGVPASAAEPMIIDFRNPSLAPAAGMVGYGIAETRTGSNWLSRYPALTGTNAGCQEIGVGNCKSVLADVASGQNNYVLQADVDLGICQSAAEEFCIESLSLSAPGIPLTRADFVREPISGGFEAVPELGLPRATAPSLWKVSQIPNAGQADTYVVRAHAEMGLAQKTKRFRVGSFSFEVFPVKITNYSDTREGLVKQGISVIPDRLGGGFGTASPPADCAFSEPGVCAKIQDFSPGTRVQLVIRTPLQVTGWFDGRADSVAIEVEKPSASFRRVTASGYPMEVPSFAIQLAPDSNEAKTLGLISGTYITNVNNKYGDGTSWLNPLKALPVVSLAAGDKATGSRSIWRLSSRLPDARTVQCASGAGVIGVVTTNAMAYSPDAPRFDGESFVYEVAGMHLTAKGDVQEGFYNLLMDSRTARCMQNLPSGLLKATVQVLDAGGVQTVTTSTFVEKDGWLNVRVAGFHFSSPTVKVKFSSAQKTTITCVSTKNKKLTKKVTAVTPKCPAGYKKK